MSAADGGGGGGSASSTSVGSTGGGSGASRSKSRYCSDIRTPPSPSVIVWCIFASSAALPPRRPSTTTNCHSGRVRSNGSSVDQRGQVEQLAERARLGQGDAADVVVDVEVGVVDPHRRREVDGRRLHAPAQAGHVPRRPLHARTEPVEVGRPVEDRQRGERRREVRILLEAPHQPLGVAHPAVGRPRPDPPTPPIGRGDAARPGQRGIDVCLNSLRSGHADVVEHALDGGDRPSAPSLGDGEEADEHRGVADDERRHAPHRVRVDVRRVLLLDRRQRAAGVDLGPHGVDVDPGRRRAPGARSLAVAELAAGRVTVLEQRVVGVEEVLGLGVADGDRRLQGEQAAVALRALPHRRLAFGDVGLTEREGEERDVPVGAGREPRQRRGRGRCGRTGSGSRR